MPFSLLFSLISLFFGLLFGGIGLFLRQAGLSRDTRCDCVTTGRVSEMRLRHHTGSDGESQLWHPVFQYTALGQAYEQESSTGSSDRRFEVGDPVTIYYNSSDPSEYVVPEDEGSDRFISTIFLGLGILWVVIAAVSFSLYVISARRF